MEEPILIDTDVAIDYLRGTLYARQLVESLWDDGGVILSILSVYELFAGMRPGEKEGTGAFIDACKVEEITLDIARQAGQLRQLYSARGITLNAIDCLINATAIMRGFKIATRNSKHYPNSDILYQI